MMLDEIWREFVGEQIFAARPDFRFDRKFYLSNAPDVAQSGVDPAAHFEKVGKREGRPPTMYRKLAKSIKTLDKSLLQLAAEPRIREAIIEGQEDAAELLFEMMMLGDPVDMAVSHFSRTYYLLSNPDLRQADVHPFLHFIQHGMKEKRRSLNDIRQNRYVGRQAFDPNLPTCLICVHEFSKTGAPIVGLDLVKSAAETQNVVVAGLRSGQLLESFLDHAAEVLVSENPNEDFPYMQAMALQHADFAILNSVECFPFAKFLVKEGVPWASYLHEYTDYTLPAYKCIFMALFSDYLVFSSNQVYKSWARLLADIDFDVERDSMIVPQHEYHVGSVKADEYQSALDTLSALIGIDCSKRRVVLGAGHVQWRKGTDLFVLAAQIARGRSDDSVFVWIGDGQNHEDVHFGVWLDKHMREADANVPGGTLHFLPAGPYYKDLCKAADAFFLSSRLDPLPNVVFDAAQNGCHTVLFRNASGFDDPTYTEQPSVTVVEYGNLEAACDALLSIPKKEPGPEVETTAASTQSGSIFTTIQQALQTRIRSQDYFVVGGGDYDVPILFPGEDIFAAVRRAERDKIWSYKRRFVWRSLRAAQTELAASDNWVHKNSRIEKFAHLGDEKTPQYSVHIHAHYTDGLGGDLLYYKALRNAERLVVTTDSDTKERQILHIARDAGVDVEVIQMGNTGRDILPFMRLFSDGYADENSVWCHIHQKKSIGTMRSGETWKKFLLAILLGDDQGFSRALQDIARPEIGLVAPFDPYQVGWAGSRRILPRFENHFDKPLPEHPIVFPVGNMFWVRGQVVTQMNDLFGPNYPWPNEPLPNDGTEFHLIERLWPAAAVLSGYHSLFLEKANQERG